ncbi:hypothetical protein LINGRAHAP2_LOCUS6803, partial [Linum grandiflorum]
PNQSGTNHQSGYPTFNRNPQGFRTYNQGTGQQNNQGFNRGTQGNQPNSGHQGFVQGNRQGNQRGYQGNQGRNFTQQHQ